MSYKIPESETSSPKFDMTLFDLAIFKQQLDHFKSTDLKSDSNEFN